MPLMCSASLMLVLVPVRGNHVASVPVMWLGDGTKCLTAWQYVNACLRVTCLAFVI